MGKTLGSLRTVKLPVPILDEFFIMVAYFHILNLESYTLLKIKYFVFSGKQKDDADGYQKWGKNDQGDHCHYKVEDTLEEIGVHGVWFFEVRGAAIFNHVLFGVTRIFNRVLFGSRVF